MSSSADPHPTYGKAALTAGAAPRSTRFWPSIIRVAAVEVMLLLTLAGVFVAYLNWSSKANFEEFLAVSSASQPGRAPANAALRLTHENACSVTEFVCRGQRHPVRTLVGQPVGFMAAPKGKLSALA